RGLREQERAAAERQVDSDPARRAMEWLAFDEWRALPETTLSDEGEIGYVAPADALEDMPEGLPSMSLDARSLDGEDIAGLPRELLPLSDVDTALATAMALKREGRVRQPQRLWAFIKAQGGIKDESGEIRQ